jgi:hypothetical protein
MTARRLALSLTISFTALLLPAVAAHAAGCDTWNGATATWGTSADWSKGVPTDGADVCIESGKVTVPSSVFSHPDESLGSLELESATLEPKIGAIVPVSGATTIGTHGALILNGTYEGANAGNASLGGGTVTNSGTITMEGEGYSATLFGAITNDGTIDVPYGIVSFGYGGNGGAGSLDNQGTIDVSPVSSSHPNAPAGVEALGAPVTDDTGGVIHNEGTFVIKSGGEPATPGSYDQGNGSETGNPISIGQDSALSYTGSGASSVEVHDSLTMTGDIAAGQKLQSDIGTVLTEASSFTNAGAIVLNDNYYGGGGGPAKIALSSGTFTNTGTILGESGDAFSGDVINSGTITLTPGSLWEQESGAFTNAAAGTISPQISSKALGLIQLDTGTSFTAGGTLAPVLTEGFLPSPGQEFNVVNTRGGTWSGSFGAVANGFGADYRSSEYIAAIYGSPSIGPTPASTTTPPPTPPTPVPAPIAARAATALVSAIAGVAGKVLVKLSCPAGGPACASATVKVSVTEHFDGGRLTAVSAKHETKAKNKTKVVVIATKSISLAAGEQAGLSLALNATGSKLLAKHRKLQALVSVSAAGKTIRTQKLTITRPASGSRSAPR